MMRNKGISLFFVLLLGVLSILFPPPSGYIGERASLQAEDVWFLDLFGHFPASGRLEVRFIAASGERFTQTEAFFHNGLGRMRFYLPPMMLESIRVDSGNRGIDWKGAEIVNLQGEIIASLNRRADSEGQIEWASPGGVMHVPELGIPKTPLNVIVDGTYVFVLVLVLLTTLFWGVQTRGVHRVSFVFLIGGSAILALLAVLGTFR